MCEEGQEVRHAHGSIAIEIGRSPGVCTPDCEKRKEGINADGTPVIQVPGTRCTAGFRNAVTGAREDVSTSPCGVFVSSSNDGAATNSDRPSELITLHTALPVGRHHFGLLGPSAAVVLVDVG